MTSIATINRLKSMAIFCQVIESGSMSAAAQRLKMTPSAVSQQITQLENQLDITLINRSTRRINLSDAGEHYFRLAKQMLALALEADDSVSELKTSLRGDMRISAPVGLASHLLAKALAGLTDKNPQLHLSVHASDTFPSLIKENIDIALGVGEPKKSSLIFHALGYTTKSIYASANYFARHDMPITPQSLASHAWLGLESKHRFSNIELTHIHSNETFQYSPDFRIRFNDMNVLLGHVLESLGLAVLPDIEVKHLLAEQKLVRILPEWQSDRHQVYALTIDRKLPHKSKVALVELKRFFSTIRN